ncbi:retron St85 family RNA-directed DNA polymerase [Bacterioplanoides sp. SCSIO 12839]|uniref:retron St85 family RNA-directed DNA polymerase n=1 Tax=Bacterioplanoides sp. SCSIO 12839 TaxID=2829569 RepID=UPI002103FAA3|nr:retron St85 family RNA-directed DNA polymerase [Bacterioplanoides sp. SCSIO 12839]UTW49166.1 retron St85 family RNA-directed DNA polymerase [Bacterioplanoides sp. SCSIO 12839]
MSLIANIARESKKTEKEVLSFLRNAPNKYKVYKIPKRTSGFRIIAQPVAELKEYQRIFVGLDKFPVHSAAMAYRKGISIKDNAYHHRNGRYLLKMDLENFFNSISNSLFWKVCKDNGLAFDEFDRFTMEKLLFWNQRKTNRRGLILSVGAPSSPYLSNFIMYLFDSEIAKYCEDNGIIYSRYADDLTFSTESKGILFQVPRIVESVLKRVFGRNIIVNSGKTVFSSKAHNRHVTGITITNEGKLSLGRDRKRYIKHLVFKFISGNAADDEVTYLQGILSFSKYVEPNFVKSLGEKYSVDVIDKIMEIKNG